MVSKPHLNNNEPQSTKSVILDREIELITETESFHLTRHVPPAFERYLFVKDGDFFGKDWLFITLLTTFHLVAIYGAYAIISQRLLATYLWSKPLPIPTPTLPWACPRDARANVFEHTRLPFAFPLIKARAFREPAARVNTEPRPQLILNHLDASSSDGRGSVKRLRSGRGLAPALGPSVLLGEFWIKDIPHARPRRGRPGPHLLVGANASPSSCPHRNRSRCP